MALIGAMMMASSCKKEMSVKVSEISGPLAGAFEVVGSEFPVEEDGDAYKVTIKLKRTGESVPYTENGVGVLAENQEALTLAGFGYDGGEKAIVEPKDSKDNIEGQKKVLCLKNGTEGELTIKFKKDEVPESIKLTTALELVSSGKVLFNGAIGKYGVKNFNVTFNFKDAKLNGQYQYTSTPAGYYLDLEGTVDDMEIENGNYEWDVHITEYGDYGDVSALFDGDLKLVRNSKDEPYHYVMTGKFENTYKGLTFQYNLQSEALGE